jgi:deoxycytidine triphosphate deaminase
MILTDDDIKAAVKAGEIVIEPFDERQVQPASIDLRVGDEGATTKHKRKINIADDSLLILEPGDFGVIPFSKR